MVEKIEGWMVTAFLAVMGVVGWGYRETHINKVQGSKISDLGDRVSKLEDKSQERGEIMARMDERQAVMAANIEKLLDK